MNAHAGRPDLPKLQDLYVLTPTQQQMLLHCVTHTDDRQMWQQFTCGIDGPLDRERLRQAWQQVVRRHDVMRTGFLWQAIDKPLQFVRPDAPLRWTEHDVSNMSREQRDAAFREMVRRDRIQPVSLTSPPLMRCTLVRHGPEEHRFLWGCHHLILDGWSVPVILSEVFATYEDAEQPEPVPRQRPRQFSDYLRWLMEQDTEAAVAHWRSRLGGYRPPRSRGSSQRPPTAWHEHEVSIPNTVVSKLRATAGRLQVTTSAVIATAWAICCATQFARSDIVIGIAVSGRSPGLPGAESIAGPLNTVLPLRLQITPTDSIEDCVRDVHQQLGELHNVFHTSLQTLQRACDLSASSRLIESLLVIENYLVPPAPAAGSALAVTDVEGTATSAYPGTLVVVPGDTWWMRLKVRSDWHAPQEPAAMLRGLIDCLSRCVGEPPVSPQELIAACRPTVSSAQQPRSSSASPPVVRPESAPKPVPPRDATEQQLVQIWTELVGVESIGIRDRFMDLGGDSAQALAMLARIEQVFQRKLPIIALFENPTIEQLARRLSRPAGHEALGQLVIPLRPGGTARPLFCVHPAGGTVFCYRSLLQHLPDDVPVFGIQAVGIEGRRLPQTEVFEMAKTYLDVLLEEFPDGPYALCGWSSGGVIAHEMACQLRHRNLDVDLLALFDAAVPMPGQQLTANDFWPMLLMMFPGETESRLAELRDQPFADQLAYFAQRAELAQLLAAEAPGATARQVYEVFQSNVHAMAAHQPRFFPGTMHLFRAANTASALHQDTNLGWTERTRQIRVYPVSGDHVTMFQEPHIRQIAAQMRRLLCQRDAASADPWHSNG